MHSSDPTFRVLHALKLRGVCGAEPLAATIGMASGQGREELAKVLAPLQADGLVKERSAGGLTVMMEGEPRSGRPDPWSDWLRAFNRICRSVRCGACCALTRLAV